MMSEEMQMILAQIAIDTHCSKCTHAFYPYTSCRELYVYTLYIYLYNMSHVLKYNQVFKYVGCTQVQKYPQLQWCREIL